MQNVDMSCLSYFLSTFATHAQEVHFSASDLSWREQDPSPNFLPRLKTLSFTGNSYDRFTQSALPIIAPSLTHLTLRCFPTTTPDFASFLGSSGCTLQSLRITHLEFHDEIRPALQAVPQLLDLDLNLANLEAFRVVINELRANTCPHLQTLHIKVQIPAFVDHDDREIVGLFNVSDIADLLEERRAALARTVFELEGSEESVYALRTQHHAMRRLLALREGGGMHVEMTTRTPQGKMCLLSWPQGQEVVKPQEIVPKKERDDEVWVVEDSDESELEVDGLVQNVNVVDWGEH